LASVVEAIDTGVTSESITHVATTCGYADHSAFSRQFKAATHTTPIQYRAAHKAMGFVA
jgi:AraC-like DNA-binding protein